MSEDNKESSKLIYTVLTYVGREFKKKFENDDGTVTKSYQYSFKEHDDQQFPIRFWGYDNTKGADSLEEGDLYNIGYITKPNPKGDKPMKLARFFGEPPANKPDGTTYKNTKQDSVTQTKQEELSQQESEPKSNEPVVTKKIVNEFLDVYSSYMNKKDITPNKKEFMRAFYMSLYKQQEINELLTEAYITKYGDDK